MGKSVNELPGIGNESQNLNHKKRIKKILLVILIIMVSLFIMNLIATKIIFHMIFARYDYRANNIDIKYTQEASVQYPREEFTFKSGKNTLSGKLYQTLEPKGVLIIAHGMHSYGDRYLDAAEFFVDHGWDVLTFDMTGTAASEGKDTIGLPQMKRDVLAAVDYAKNSPALAGLPIVLYGHSMGGYAVATAIEDNPDIKAAVCLSAFNNPSDIMLVRALDYAGFAANLGYPSMYMENLYLFGSDAIKNASDVLKNQDIPVLVIQGNNDNAIPEDLTLYAHRDEVTNPNVTFLLIDEKYRDEHSTLWLTQECAEYTLEVHEKFDALEDEYHGEIPDDVYAQFEADVDWDRLNVLDEDFMDMVDEFLTEAINR